jgi:hypothetical protein
MEEILPGLHHWTATHPNHPYPADCFHVAPAAAAIDPLLPEDGLEWFDRHPVELALLSNRHHLRHAAQIAARFGCPILCHESGLHEFNEGPQVTGFAFGDEPAPGIRALEVGAICPDDTALLIDSGDGALLFADAVINVGELGFVPDPLIGEDPEGVKEAIRGRCRELLREPFDNLLFAHGAPIIGGGREALREFCEG